MAITTMAGTAAATAVVKRIVDDLYLKVTDYGANVLGKNRSEVRDAAIAKSLSSVTKVKTLWNVENGLLPVQWTPT